MRTKWFVLFIGLLIMFSLRNGNAATLTGERPTSSDGTLDALLEQAWNNAITEANDELEKYSDQEDLARGFANANAYSSHAGTFQGFQNYKLFAVTAGIMAGIQMPSLDPAYDVSGEVENEGDIYAGIGAGISFVNIGINAGFITKGLYLNVKYGGLTFKPIDEIKIENTIIGMGVNYSVLRGSGILGGLAKWRGISVGTGFIYHSSNVEMDIELDEIRETLGGAYTTDELVVDPSIELGLNVKTYTIPLDVTTSIQALWILNFTLGAGVDFSFGKSDIIIESDGNVTVDGPLAPSLIASDGYVRVDGSTKNISPSFVRPRLMAGLGFNFGPVKIDIPVIYYLSAGAAIGITAGVVW